VTGRRIDLPALRGRRHQHDARSRTGLAQRVVKAANGFGGARHLDADRRIHIDLVVRGGVLDCDLVDIDFELFREQHRQRRVGPLAHLNLGRDERHFASAVDAQESVRRERRVGGKRVAHFAECGEPEAEQQTAADGCRRSEKPAPRQ
jgi:hypothetical protein